MVDDLGSSVGVAHVDFASSAQCRMQRFLMRGKEVRQRE